MTAKPGRFKAAVLDWLGIPVSLTDTAFWNELATNNSGVCVNQTTMLKLSAVWACTRLISETIATLPLSIYERTSAGKRVADQHPLQFVVHDQPNPDSTASVFWEAVVAAMLLRGCARAERLMVGSRMVGLMFLAPDRLAISRRGDGTLRYAYTESNGRQREIPANRIYTIPGFSLDGKNGVSVIAYGANVFGSAIATDLAASKTFERGLLPTVAISYPAVLKPDQRKEAREAIETLSGAVNAGKAVILEAGMTSTNIGINPVDAQMLESRGFNVEEICRWFRVPPFMVGHSEKATSWGTGIEQQMIGFLTFTLAPWLRRIEQSINKDLLLPADRNRYYAKFSVEGLLRADSAGRASFYAAMVNNGIYVRDEVRELEDRPPMGGNAAVLTVQSAMTPLDSIGTNTDSQRMQAAMKEWLREPAE